MCEDYPIYAKLSIAAKKRKCCVCGRAIKPTSRYYDVSIVLDDGCNYIATVLSYHVKCWKKQLSKLTKEGE